MSAGKSARLSICEIAELSLFCALMVAGKECLRLIPNVHPVTLLLLLATAVYGAKALYPAFGFALLEIAHKTQSHTGLRRQLLLCHSVLLALFFYGGGQIIHIFILFCNRAINQAIIPSYVVFKPTSDVS